MADVVVMPKNTEAEEGVADVLRSFVAAAEDGTYRAIALVALPTDGSSTETGFAAWPRDTERVIGALEAMKHHILTVSVDHGD